MKRLALSSLLFSVIALIMLCCSVRVAHAASVPSNSLKAYLNDLQTELSILSNTQTKLSLSIGILSQSNDTTQLVNMRTAQLQKIQLAVSRLTLETNVIADKCNRYAGDNCNSGCNIGYIGTDCNTIATCFGIKFSNSSVCSGKGSCIALDTCNCTSPYIGTKCQSTQPTNVTLSSSGGGFKYADGTFARSCKEYRNATYPYVYSNEGSGLYQIKPGNTSMTVYCDMETLGGGWTLIAGLTTVFAGKHFHIFNEATAVASSYIDSFHIPTKDLLAISTQLRVGTDKASAPVINFYTATWPQSTVCDIPDLLRSDIQATYSASSYSALSNFVQPERQANCKIIAPSPATSLNVPTHMSYCKSNTGTGNQHSIGLRIGIPVAGQTAQYGANASGSAWITYSFLNAPEGYWFPQSYNGVFITEDYSLNRNGVVFLR